MKRVVFNMMGMKNRCSSLLQGSTLKKQTERFFSSATHNMNNIPKASAFYIDFKVTLLKDMEVFLSRATHNMNKIPNAAAFYIV